MRIACPTCAATYEVPDDMLKPGQMVRCARCAKEWAPAPGAELDAPALAVPPSRDPPSDSMAETPSLPERRPATDHRLPPPRRPPPPSRNARLRVAWAASLLILAGLLWAAYSQRAAIMQAWPPSARLYNALGLHDGH